MAVRPVYTVDSNPDSSALYTVTNPNFKYYCGLAKIQRQRSYESLHQAYHDICPDVKILEVSTQSASELGFKLSPFNLTIRMKSGREVTVESAYQAGKIFGNGGPYLDLLDGTSMAAKKDARRKTAGPLTGYVFDDEEFPTEPKTFFYDWLYIHALIEHPDLSKSILKYDSFTDIVYNPKKGSATQAEACAVYVSLVRRRELKEALESRENFLRIVFGKDEKGTEASTESE